MRGQVRLAMQKKQSAEVEPDNNLTAMTWNALRAHAKVLGIATHGLKRDEIEKKIREAMSSE